MCRGSVPASFIARPSDRFRARFCHTRRRQAAPSRYPAPGKNAMAPNATVEARAYPRPLPNPEWLAKRTEEILEPGLPIVDPHHHLCDHPGSRYLLDELLDDVNFGHNIVATVFIQSASWYCV